MTDTITKQEPKLSVRKPGHWRNKWIATRTGMQKDGKSGRVYHANEGDEIFGDTKFPTAEMAEQKAHEFLQRPRQCGPAKYLGPVFFPEGDDA